MNITCIHQIEVTTMCNLACIYCPHPKMQRKKEHMGLEVYIRALKWVEYFNDIGSQKELALTGIGEALMHPQFKDFLIIARGLYNGFIHFSTNGILFTEFWAKLCAELKIGVYVSMHRPEVAVPAKLLADKHGVLVAENHAFVDNAINWAGTVDWYVSAKPSLCRYQSEGWGVVMVDGSVTTCCMDSEGVSVLGHIDDELGTINMVPKELCGQCHLRVA